MVSDKDASLPGSVHDTLAAVDGNSYYTNYRAIAVFLVALDSLASKLHTDDPLWSGQPSAFHLDPNDLPYIH